MIKTRTLVMLAAGALAATTTAAAVDVADFHGQAKLLLNSSPSTGGTVTIKLTHSDTAGGVYTDAGVAFADVTAASASAQALDFNVDKLKRFVKVVVTLNGAATAVTPAVTLIGLKQSI